MSFMPLVQADGEEDKALSHFSISWPEWGGSGHSRAPHLGVQHTQGTPSVLYMQL